jgi:branched-chain amino acid transport system ATP-binding protein
MLEARHLCKRFGGLVAVDDVSLRLMRGHVHCIIGPNGAGKSTLVNLLSGDMASSGGKITLCGKDVTRVAAEHRSRMGLGRSFQKTNIFPALSVYQNVHLAAQSRAPQPWKIFSSAYRRGDIDTMIDASLNAAGLMARRDTKVAELSHGEQRQVEIAMLLATQPSVLLLDEPLAGVGHSEAAGMMSLLQSLKKGHAILLIEHDMDAVFAIADTLTVMMNGKVLASGTPAEIRSNQEVQAAYLGHDEAMHG